MDKKTSIKLCEEKINELKATIEALKVTDKLSKATRGTQLYQRGRERRILHLVEALLKQIDAPKLEEADMNTFNLITTLAEERVAQTLVEVHEGDKITDLLSKYENKKKIFEKLRTAAEKIGCKLDLANDKVVKA